MKRLMILLTLATLAGCATIEGVGNDIAGGSRRVQGWF